MPIGYKLFVLKRELTRLDSLATIVGMMVGSGIFVAIGEASKTAGPSTVLAYLVLAPVTLILAFPYMIFQSTSLGSRAGGAYLHISRTFQNHYFAFIVMWLTWITYLGVLSVLSISVGTYLKTFWPSLDPKVAAAACLIIFYLINLVGVKQFGLIQSAMFVVLIASVVCLVVSGLTAVSMHNFVPFLPYGWEGFFKALPILFFAYAGFDALSQTAEETKDARRSLPMIFLVGVCCASIIYVGISFVTFGAHPFEALSGAQAPLAYAATSFLPFGHLIVTIGALMAFLTTINACMMVPSRILFAFANDRVAPRILSATNNRFGTPHISLTINLALSLFLVWTKTIGYLIAISMQALIIFYAAECLALICLPFVNKPLWGQAEFRINKIWLVLAGSIGIAALVFLYMNIPNPFSRPLLIWAVIGTIFYLFERRQGRLQSFDYKASLTSFLNNPSLNLSE